MTVRIGTLLLLALIVALLVPTVAHGYTRSQHRVRRTIALTLQAQHVAKADRVAAIKLAGRESGWRATAVNGSCKGVFQLWTYQPRSKWSSVVWSTRRANRYVIVRYGSWRRALAHSYSRGWY